MGRLSVSLCVLFLAAASCSFDYGTLSEEEARSAPDVVMSDVEYVRVRDGKPVVRLQAETVERYEKDRRMIVAFPRFFQYASDGEEGASGGASSAVVDLASGDVSLYGAVVLSVPREEMVIETDMLSWFDQDRVLSGDAESPVLVKKADCSFLSGFGFSADARRKSWTLSGSVSGTLVEDDEDGEPAP